MKQSKLAFNLLIGTFVLLYMFVAFVSTFHAIAFFQLANVTWMGILLAVAYEIGQASVLFAILTTDNNKRLLPWLMMILLTSVQIIGNVYSSFKHIDSGGSNDWQYWQRSILFWMETGDSEMFKVVISWITGALLPIVALGMTALVAENINLRNGTKENEESPEDDITPDDTPKDEKPKKDLDDRVKGNELKEDTDIKLDFSDMPDKKKEFVEEVNDLLDLQDFKIEESEKETFSEKDKKYAEELLEDKTIVKDSNANELKDSAEVSIKEEPLKFKEDEIKNNPKGKKVTKKPSNASRGWHLRKKHVDTNGDVYRYGIFQKEEKESPPVIEKKSSKKA